MRDFITRFKFGYLLFLLLPMLLHAVGPVVQAPRDSADAPSDFQLIVELTDPSVIESLRAALPAGMRQPSAHRAAAIRAGLRSSEAGRYRVQVENSQRRLLSRMSEFEGVEVLHSVGLVMNAVIVRAPARHYRSLRRLTGVKKVYRARRFAETLDTAAEIQNAPGMWDLAGGSENAGRGIKIGIIDSGIDIDNPMFIDPSLTPPAGYPRGETLYTNSKVIVAHNYISLLENRQSVDAAIDERGHGTFVAGCAAGKRVAAPKGVISGMAPSAFLGSYKVLGTPGINDYASDSAIIAATDAAVADGMDVLNYSLGSLDYVSPSEDPLAIAVNGAIEAGAVVVGSAGNDGPDAQTISSPNTNPASITVGAVSNARGISASLHVSDPAPVPDLLRNVPYKPSGDGPQFVFSVGPAALVNVTLLGDNGLACSPLPADSLSGKIAFIKRGECFFYEKVNNVKAGSAVAAVIYNHLSGEDAVVMGNMSGTTIPAAALSNPDGLRLKDFLDSNPDSTRIEIEPSSTLLSYATTPRMITDFSARGPGPDYALKPDLVAVGKNVYSAVQNNNVNGSLYDISQFAVANGTSFSSPMVAGAAAVIKQLHPGFSPAAVKSVLVNTASRDLTVDGSRPPNILEAGSGLLDMAGAARASATFDPPLLDFGAAPYYAGRVRTHSLRITNFSAESDQFSLAVEPLISGPDVLLSSHLTTTLASGASASVDVTIQANAPLSGAFQGFITARSQRTSALYRIPYWAGLYFPDNSRTIYVEKGTTVSGRYEALNDALRDARPGNAIEILDSETYTGGIIIGASREGLPLEGITIRAAPGEVPTINGGKGSDAANIKIVGVPNVLLQGIRSIGGAEGVRLTSMAGFPASVTIDNSIIENAAKGDADAGVRAEQGGAVAITKSSFSGFLGPGVEVGAGTQLTVLDSTIENNRISGIDAVEAKVLLVGATVRNNSFEGIYLDRCTGTLNRCIVSSNRGTSGYGLRVSGGQLTISDSTFASNDQTGIAIRSIGSPAQQPVATVEGNVVEQNKQYGITVTDGKDVHLERNLVKGNVRGVRLEGSTTALLVNNIIVRSSSPWFGDGLFATGKSKVRCVNNTVYQNQGRGLVSDNYNLSVINTISAGNSGGDAVGRLLPGHVQYSFIGDGTLTGYNNLSGDPRFADPAADVPVPGTDSPAINAGSNLVTDLPFIDFNRRLRIASAGALVGEGLVDIGAVEVAASYPLIFPMLAYGTPPGLGGDYTTGFAILNKEPDEVTARFTGFNPQGSLLPGADNPGERSFLQDVQLPILIWQLLGLNRYASHLGAVLANSPRPLYGFFMLMDYDFSHWADGVVASDESGAILYFPRHQHNASGTSDYVVFNPGVNPASVTATPYRAGGSPLDMPAGSMLAPKGQALFRFDKLTADSGYVRVVSDHPVAGMEIFGDNDAVAALAAAIPASDTTLYYPHFAANQGFSSLIGAINTNTSDAVLELKAFSNDGIQTGPSILRTLAPGAQLLESVSALFGLGSEGIATGYATLQSSQPGIVGFSLFYYSQGAARSAAAVPAMAAPRRKLLFSHIAHQAAAGGGGTYQTGIALLNPFGTPVPFTMRVFDGNGIQVAELSDTLAPRQKMARLLSHPIPGAGFFTKSIRLSFGHVEVVTDYALLGFEMFYTEDFSQLSSVPAQISR